jgi:hypothetical protein
MVPFAFSLNMFALFFETAAKPLLINARKRIYSNSLKGLSARFCDARRGTMGIIPWHKK